VGHRSPAAGGPRRIDVVVVPRRPGRVIHLDDDRSRRGRDDLDNLIDELLPEVDEEPGWFDVALLLLGGALLLGPWVSDAGPIVAVFGVVALCLGCVLPIRTGWRHAGRRRAHGRRAALLARGVLLDISSPGVATLVGAYDDLFRVAGGSSPWIGRQAMPAAHVALMEVASLLGGHPPRSERQRAFVDQRARAVADLCDALRELPSPAQKTPPRDPFLIEPDVLIETWEGLDQISPFNSVTRIEAIIDEARIRRGA
jgi:hypothetical protein